MTQKLHNLAKQLTDLAAINASLEETNSRLRHRLHEETARRQGLERTLAAILERQAGGDGYSGRVGGVGDGT